MKKSRLGKPLAWVLRQHYTNNRLLPLEEVRRIVEGVIKELSPSHVHLVRDPTEQTTKKEKLKATTKQTTKKEKLKSPGDMSVVLLRVLMVCDTYLNLKDDNENRSGVYGYPKVAPDRTLCHRRYSLATYRSDYPSIGQHLDAWDALLQKFGIDPTSSDEPPTPQLTSLQAGNYRSFIGQQPYLQQDPSCVTPNIGVSIGAQHFPPLCSTGGGGYTSTINTMQPPPQHTTGDGCFGTVAAAGNTTSVPTPSISTPDAYNHCPAAYDQHHPYLGNRRSCDNADNPHVASFLTDEGATCDQLTNTTAPTPPTEATHHSTHARTDSEADIGNFGVSPAPNEVYSGTHAFPMDSPLQVGNDPTFVEQQPGSSLSPNANAADMNDDTLFNRSLQQGFPHNPTMTTMAPTTMGSQQHPTTVMTVPQNWLPFYQYPHGLPAPPPGGAYVPGIVFQIPWNNPYEQPPTNGTRVVSTTALQGGCPIGYAPTTTTTAAAGVPLTDNPIQQQHWENNGNATHTTMPITTALIPYTATDTISTVQHQQQPPSTTSCQHMATTMVTMPSPSSTPKCKKRKRNTSEIEDNNSPQKGIDTLDAWNRYLSILHDDQQLQQLAADHQLRSNIPAYTW